MTVNVRANLDVIERHVTGCTVVIEQARGPSYFGAKGEKLDFWNLTTPTGKTPLAQADTALELSVWAKRHGCKRAEIID